MTYHHPDIRLEEPHPGYFVATYTPRSFTTTQGTVVPPGILIVPAEIPAGLLRALADEKEKKAVKEARSVKTVKSVKVVKADPAVNAAPADTPQSWTAAAILADGPMDGRSLATRVVNVLHADANHRLRVSVIAEVLGVEPEDVKALNGQGFTLGRGGWATLNAGGEA